MPRRLSHRSRARVIQLRWNLTLPASTATSEGQPCAELSEHLSLTANYTFAKAETWGCVLGELFDYVNGMCDPLHPFSPGRLPTIG